MGTKLGVQKYEGRLGKLVGKIRFRLNGYINMNVDKDYAVQVWTGWIHMSEGEDQGELL